MYSSVWIPSLLLCSRGSHAWHPSRVASRLVGVYWDWRTHLHHHLLPACLCAHAQVVEQGLQGVAVLQVAHSLGAVTGYDRVLVMEGGQVVEGGAPQELLGRQGSRFAALYRAGQAV
jgi:hypothetical protein